MIISKLNDLDFFIVIFEISFCFSVTLWPRMTLLPDNQRWQKDTSENSLNHMETKDTQNKGRENTGICLVTDCCFKPHRKIIEENRSLLIDENHNYFHFFWQ